MVKAGILTSDRVPELLDYDRRLIAELKKTGIDAEPVIWDSPGKDWHCFDFLLMRTAWGYYHNYQKFLEFISEIKKENITIFNSADIIVKNSHKFYLKDLKAAGVNIIPTHFIRKRSVMSAAKLVKISKWNKYILKPAVSAGSYDIHLYDTDDPEGENQFQQMVQDNDVLIQKYIPEIANGELSTVYFGGDFRYTVRKIPKQGDYRVQREYGGVYEKTEPPAEVVSECEKVIELLEGDFLYARIDGVISQGTFRIMEVEMIEPDLYMDLVPEAIPNFVKLIASRIEAL